MERPVPASPNLPLIALLWLLRCGYGFTVFCCCCRCVWGSSATRVDKATFLIILFVCFCVCSFFQRGVYYRERLRALRFVVY